jgi:hypothetical protein
LETQVNAYNNEIIVRLELEEAERLVQTIRTSLSPHTRFGIFDMILHQVEIALEKQDMTDRFIQEQKKKYQMLHDDPPF